jgi:sugar lactone lactonase YvrE
LICRDVATGKPRWTVSVASETGAKPLGWGIASSPLVAGDLVYVQSGSGGAIAVAVTKVSGTVAWRSAASGVGGYAHPILADVGGQRLLIVLGGEAIYGMDPLSGRTLWEYPWKTSFDVNSSTPIYRDGKLFVTSEYDHGCAQLAVSPGGATRVWENKNILGKFQGAILDGDHLYANSAGTLVCVSWKDGSLVWRANDSKLRVGIGGSLVRVGDKLITLSERGKLSLLRATPAGVELIGQGEAVEGKEVWATPVLYGGRLYAKGGQELVCLEITPGGGSAGAAASAVAKEELFVATPLTEVNSFTAGVEGPACDAVGNVYAVNFAREQTIGRVTPDGRAEVFVTLPGKSVGNGIVFDRAGVMYVADYVGHNVLRVDPVTRAVGVFAHEERMNQPNDLAIAPDGTLYASDPDWKRGVGQVWRIDRAGKVTLVSPNMGTTNGIDVSPDGTTLYVNESVQRNIWAFTIASPDGSLSNKRLVKRFDDHGFDGMRCDVDGNLYVTRHGKGTVVKLSPAGEVLREVDVLGPMPTNICFGGPDGRTAYVTEVSGRRLVQFRVDRPGLAWARWPGR